MIKGAIKSGIKRAVKAVGFLAVAGLVSQIPSFCGLVPSVVTGVLSVFGLSCSAVLASAGLGLEKALNYKEDNSNG